MTKLADLMNAGGNLSDNDNCREIFSANNVANNLRGFSFRLLIRRTEVSNTLSLLTNCNKCSMTKFKDALIDTKSAEEFLNFVTAK